MNTSTIRSFFSPALMGAASGAAGGIVFCVISRSLNKILGDSSKNQMSSREKKQMLETAAYVGSVLGAILGVMNRFCSNSIKQGAVLGFGWTVCSVLLPLTMEPEIGEEESMDPLNKVVLVALSSIAAGAAIGAISSDS